jgi:hypothetical protein
MTDIITRIGNEYDPGGFIYLLREGLFIQSKANEFIELISQLDFDNEDLSIELLRFVWHLPIMLQWLMERAGEGSDLYDNISALQDQVISTFEDIIGIP